MKSNWIYYLFAVFAVFTLLILIDVDTGYSKEPETPVKEKKNVAEAAKEKFDFALSVGEEAASKNTADTLAKTQTLASGRAEDILKRLPALPDSKSLSKDFNVREKSLPAPKGGEIVKVPFPNPEEIKAAEALPEASDKDPASLVRWSPDGSVGMVQGITLTFDKPMTALQGVSESRSIAPASISPEVKGTWRWLGTKTAVFDPEGQYLPMSNKYTVTVKSDLKDASGKALGKDYSFSFSTETLKIISRYPVSGQTTSSTPVFALVFNQKIDAEKLKKFICVAKDGFFKKSSDISLLTIDELKASKLEGASSVSSMLKDIPAGRYIIFKTDKVLDADSSYTVCLNKGAVSAEGSLTAPAEQSYTFSTFEPLKIVDTNGSGFWGRDYLSENDCFAFRFNNTIDLDKFSEDKCVVSFSPETENVYASCSGNTVLIAGDIKSDTVYKVKLSPEITDIYGQKLGNTSSYTFKVGPADPYMDAPGSNLNILDPESGNKYSVYTANIKNLRVKLFTADIEDYFTYCKDWRLRSIGKDLEDYEGIGKKLWYKEINPKGGKNELIQTDIDVSEAVKDGKLAMLCFHYDTGRGGSISKIVWLQSSSIAVDAFYDKETVYCLASDLKTGRPKSGVNIKIQKEQGVTDRTGCAKLSAGSLIYGDHKNYIEARDGNDIVYFVFEPKHFEAKDRVLWSVFDDRGLYRPKESVHFKGWIGLLKYGSENNGKVLGEGIPVHWNIKDARYADIASGSMMTDAYGAFSLEAVLPDNINLGKAHLELNVDKNAYLTEYRHEFNVQEFRRPEFEVTASASEGDNIMGESGSITAKASYFSGGSVSESPITWKANSSNASYSPAGWDKFTFGTWRPWWRCWWLDPEPSNTVSHELESTTDVLGKSTLKIDFGTCYPPKPISISAEAAVSDLNRQRWNCKKSILVHPSEVYVGIKNDSFRISENERFETEFIVADISGKAVSGRPVSLTWDRLEYSFDKKGKRSEKVVETKKDSFVSEGKPSVRSISLPASGMWRLTAETSDIKGRLNQSSMTFTIGDFPLPGKLKNSVEQLTLIPDKKEYQPGETAKILVQVPFEGASGTYTISRDGIIRSESFEVKGSSAELSIPVSENWLPNAELEVLVNGVGKRTDSKGKSVDGTARPACAKANISLNVSLKEKELTVKAVPENDKLKPGDGVNVNVLVTDWQGKPVPNAQTALVVVDDSVWALSGHSIASPLRSFYLSRSSSSALDVIRGTVLLNGQKAERSKNERAVFKSERAPSRMSDMVEGVVCFEAAPMMGAAKNAAAPPMPMMAMSRSAAPAAKAASDDAPIALRSNFDPLAVFAASVITDAEGRAKVFVKLPDNLTRYRIIAVTSDKETRFGKGESSLTACLPLMVRPNAPRFLNFGDSFELPVILHNQTNSPVSAEVAFRASNLRIEGGSGVSCTIPADSRREVRIPIQAEEVGKGVVQIAAVSDRGADSCECSIPVYTPCTTEGFADYGTFEESKTIVQPVDRPKNAYSQFGGLEISTSSTALHELTDAVIYLCRYPFDCSEQISSRIIVTSELYEVLDAFKAKELPEASEIKSKTNEDIKELCRRQYSNGGFGLWVREKHIMPYTSVHCAQALVTAKKHGYNVSSNVYGKCVSYLKKIDSHIPSEYSETSKAIIRAYADNVLWQMKEADYGKALGRIKNKDLSKLPIEVLGWYLPLAKDHDEALAAEIRRVLNNSISETESSASIGRFVEDQGYLVLQSDMKSEAVVLSGLIYDNPKNDIIPKVVKSLQSGRKKGHWGNTQSNAHVVMALNKYFNAYESVTPDFAVSMWIGDAFAGTHKYKGRQNIEQQTFIPMNFVNDGGRVTIDKQGPGRLYYRLGLSYALKDLAPKPLEAGFAVSRTYEGVDNPEDAKQDAEGNWHFKLGSRIRCRAEVVAPARRSHVALTVPIPAGGEIINGALKMTESVPKDTKPENLGRYGCWWFWRPVWFDHQNLRDERAEAFSLILGSGKHDYSFVFRATVPGTFVVPPAKAEEMYSPEVFGRSEGIKAIIE